MQIAYEYDIFARPATVCGYIPTTRALTGFELSVVITPTDRLVPDMRVISTILMFAVCQRLP